MRSKKLELGLITSLGSSLEVPHFSKGSKERSSIGQSMNHDRWIACQFKTALFSKLYKTKRFKIDEL